MYNYSFELLDMDYRYLAFDIKLEEVKNTIFVMKIFNMKGVNIIELCKSVVCDDME